MALSAGTRLGPYEIHVSIGAGGMGEVYRATDTRLHREVAVKVSAENFSDRFEREARAVGALNHPNICTLFDVGPNYLVMELVEGETLAERIKRGAIPLEEALVVARQIADALEAAHEKGIVHRDLKPANIKIKPDGAVKVLDFGLAKMAGPVEASGGNPANSPTMTLELATQAGVIMGTAGYMSPEQARGKNVDKRADIFAFGVVLYEMLRGGRLFEGETVSDTLAKVLMQEPDLRAVPVKVQRLLGRCLEKDSKKRLRDIGEVWVWLEEKPAVKPAQRNWLPWGLTVLAAGLAVTSFFWLRLPPPDVRSTQFHLLPPGDTQFANGVAQASPDSRYLVFGTGLQGSGPLWLRPLDSLSARQLQGTEGGTAPFWSPDSKSIAFFAVGKLKRSDIVGGAPQVLANAQNLFGGGGTWSRDGVILFSSTGGLFRVPASGGIPQQVTQLGTAGKESEHSAPQFLPDGKRFLYLVLSADPNVGGIYASSLENPKERMRILAADRKAYFVPSQDDRSGFLLWLREQTLLAQPFNAANLRLEGDPTPLAEDVVLGPPGRAAFWTSGAGLLVHRSGPEATTKGKLIWISRDGKRLGEAGKEDRYASIRLSPDNKRIAVGRYDDGGNADIWLLEFGREVMTRLTFDPRRDLIPVWSPDGRHVAFNSDRSGIRQIYRKEAGGGGQEEQLTDGPNNKVVTDWSRDGHYLLYNEISPTTGNDLWAFPVSGGQWQVSTQGGTRPKWRADGKELYYLGPNGNQVLTASIHVVGASFQSDTPHELFPIFAAPSNQLSPYDVTGDGQRFLVLQSASGQGPAPLTVVTNWQAGLKK